MASDAHGTDPAGNQVGVLLFVDNGYLSGVEVYSLGGDDFAGLPDPGGAHAERVEQAASRHAPPTKPVAGHATFVGTGGSDGRDACAPSSVIREYWPKRGALARLRDLQRQLVPIRIRDVSVPTSFG
jgi:hypothetical protein